MNIQSTTISKQRASQGFRPALKGLDAESASDATFETLDSVKLGARNTLDGVQSEAQKIPAALKVGLTSMIPGMGLKSAISIAKAQKSGKLVKNKTNLLANTGTALAQVAGLATGALAVASMATGNGSNALALAKASAGCFAVSGAAGLTTVMSTSAEQVLNAPELGRDLGGRAQRQVVKVGNALVNGGLTSVGGITTVLDHLEQSERGGSIRPTIASNVFLGASTLASGGAALTGAGAVGALFLGMGGEAAMLGATTVGLLGVSGLSMAASTMASDFSGYNY
ncbi:MAG: hypothetical protein GW833_06265 [Desulfuromonadales bacterium]|nr:hypothetical protein [Desulfuromonadales bacterium]